MNSYRGHAVARVLPVATLPALAVALAWRAAGSTAADDWLGTAVVTALLVLLAVVTGAAGAPARAAAAGLIALACLAAWTALSIGWTPVPTLAREEALLVALYALVAALPLLLLRGPVERLAVLGVLALAASGTAVAAGVALATAAEPASLFRSGRLEYPVAYANAGAAVFMVGLWPALVLAAARALPVIVRGLALAAAAAILAGWLTTQSKGAAVGLVVSAVAVFAIGDGRLRLAVPALLAAGAATALAAPLTEPYRAAERDAAAAAAGAGRALLAVTGAALVVGIVYALLDRRVRLDERRRRRVAQAAAVATAAALAAAAAVALARVGPPGPALGRAWDAFSTYHADERGTATHLATLGGSNRYDFWRVSLERFRDNPVAGSGSRSFGAVYLQEGRSHETPARAHSIFFDTLLELGIVGTILVVVALAAFLVPAARAARRRRAHGIAALGGGVAWIAHAGVDWTWTFPAAGIPAFLLLGLGASRDDAEPLARRGAVAVAAATVAVTAALVPTWLAARFVDRAERDARTAPEALRWARTLDPISARPLIVESNLAPDAAAAVPPLRRAAEREPRSVGVRFLLGVRLLEAGRRDEAIRELERARTLAPNDELVAATLARARAGS